MDKKRDVDFFEHIKNKTFQEFMQIYSDILLEFDSLMLRYYEAVGKDQFPTKILLTRMRTKSLEIEKMGKMFRNITIQRQK